MFSRKRSSWHALKHSFFLIAINRRYCLPHHHLMVDVKEDTRHGVSLMEPLRYHPFFTHFFCLSPYTRSSHANQSLSLGISQSSHTSPTGYIAEYFSAKGEPYTKRAVLHTSNHCHLYHSLLFHALSFSNQPHIPASVPSSASHML